MTPPLKPTKTEPKAQLTPYKTMHAFPRSPVDQELYPHKPTLSSLLEWSQVTHILPSTKTSRVYKPVKSPFYSTFARQLCEDAHFPGWLSAFHNNKHSRQFQQALNAQIGIIIFNKLENLFVLCGGSLQSSAWPHESATSSLQRVVCHIKGT